jgi:hypothetical protein
MQTILVLREIHGGQGQTIRNSPFGMKIRTSAGRNGVTSPLSSDSEQGGEE